MKHGDYSTYINSLKNKKMSNGNYLNTNASQQEIIISSRNTEYDIFFTDKGSECNPITITYDKRVTYIEQPLDINENGSKSETTVIRSYFLQANNSIPNGTFKTIVNNININNSSQVNLITEKTDGFTMYSKKYTNYTFVYQGEDLELLWNSGLNNGSGAWTVVKYGGLFK